MGKLGPIRHTIPIVPESGTKVADFRANSNHAAKMTRIDGKAGAQVRLLDPGQLTVSPKIKADQAMEMSWWI